MDKFIKNGSNIYVRPQGEKYDINDNKVYRLKYNSMEDIPYLSIEENFDLPSKIYKNKGDDAFIKKCVTTYKNTSRKTTGILLKGLKGSGKTLMSKQIALESGVPIIVVDAKFPEGEIESFFGRLDGDYCIIFDEFEKNWMTYRLLGFFDGLKTNCKKLIICTCNNENKLDDNLLDRCSRIRYVRSFNKLNVNVIEDVISNALNDKKNIDKVKDFIVKNMNVISFDNILLFVEEINNSPESELEDLFNDLNLSNLNNNED